MSSAWSQRPWFVARNVVNRKKDLPAKGIVVSSLQTDVGVMRFAWKMILVVKTHAIPAECVTRLWRIQAIVV